MNEHGSILNASQRAAPALLRRWERIPVPCSSRLSHGGRDRHPKWTDWSTSRGGVAPDASEQFAYGVHLFVGEMFLVGSLRELGVDRLEGTLKALAEIHRKSAGEAEAPTWKVTDLQLIERVLDAVEGLPSYVARLSIHASNVSGACDTFTSRTP